MVLLLLLLLLHGISMCIHLDTHNIQYSVHKISIDHCIIYRGNVCTPIKKKHKNSIWENHVGSKTMLSIKNIPHTICPQQVNLQQLHLNTNTHTHPNTNTITRKKARKKIITKINLQIWIDFHKFSICKRDVVLFFRKQKLYFLYGGIF